MELLLGDKLPNIPWLDARIEPASNSNYLRYWHIIFFSVAAFITIVVMLCCCCRRFRIPRTKQEIEANYQRRVITKKFREKLEKIKNTDLENMDLSRALEKIQSGLLMDRCYNNASLTQEEARLIGSSGGGGVPV